MIDVSEEIPLKPVGKEDVRKLELALLLGTLLRPDVLEKVRSSEDRLTWLDSLVVAAGALARERAGYSASKIADELGRTEATIRNHLTGKTEAGKLVRETYDGMRSKGVLEIPMVSQRELEELRERIRRYEDLLRELEERMKELEDLMLRMKELFSKFGPS
ncbi:MAG: transcriptional regulator [Candidatus Korarchaeum sp.]